MTGSLWKRAVSFFTHAGMVALQDNAAGTSQFVDRRNQYNRALHSLSVLFYVELDLLNHKLAHITYAGSRSRNFD